MAGEEAIWTGTTTGSIIRRVTELRVDIDAVRIGRYNELQGITLDSNISRPSTALLIEGADEPTLIVRVGFCFQWTINRP